MSADLVPGCILRLALASIILCSMVGSWFEELPSGDFGPIWISVGGGGLGSLGERGDRDILTKTKMSLSGSDRRSGDKGRFKAAVEL